MEGTIVGSWRFAVGSEKEVEGWRLKGFRSKVLTDENEVWENIGHHFFLAG